MGNFTFLAVVVLSLHLVLALSQLAMDDINPSNGAGLFNCQGTLFESTTYNSSGCSDLATAQVDTDNVAENLPEAVSNDQGSATTSTGNIFVDAVGSISKFFKGAIGVITIGGRMLISFVTAPYNFIKAFNLPNGFTFVIGAFWYVIEILLIMAFMFGRAD